MYHTNAYNNAYVQLPHIDNTSRIPALPVVSQPLVRSLSV